MAETVRKKRGRRIGRALLRLSLGVLVLVMLAHMALACAVMWLGTAPGNRLIRAQIAQALEGSGYSLDYKSVFYSLYDGLTVVGLRVADTQGPVLDADIVSARVDMIPILFRRATAGLQARHVVLHRLPDAGERTDDTADDADPAGFAVPDIYFRTLALNALSIRTLEIREGVAGTPLILSPRLRARADIGPSLRAVVEGRIGQPRAAPVAWIPRRLTLRAHADRQAEAITLDTLRIKADAFDIAAQGQADRRPAGKIDMTLTAAVPDLSRLAPGQEGRARLSAHLSGETARPALEASATLSLSALSAQGFSALDAALKAQAANDGYAGDIAVTTAWNEQPVSAQSGFTYHDARLHLSPLRAAAPGLDAEGDVTLDTGSGLAHGALRVRADDLSLLRALIGQDIAGKAVLGITLSAEQSTQALSGTLDASALRFGDIRAGRVTLAATLPDAANPWPHALDLSVTDASAPGADLRALSVTLEKARAEDRDYALRLRAAGRLAEDFTVSGTARVTGLQDAPAATGPTAPDAEDKPAPDTTVPAPRPAPGLRDADIVIGGAGSTLRLKGDIDGAAADLRLAAQDLSPALFTDALPVALRAMRVNGTARLHGPHEAPLLDTDLSAAIPVPGHAEEKLSLSLKGGYARDAVRLTAQGSGAGIRTLKAEAQIPAGFSLRPFRAEVVKNAPLSATVTADADAAVATDIFMPPGQALAGALRLDARLGGTAAKPELSGTLSMTDGRYENTAYGLTLADLDLLADLRRDDTLRLQRLSATDGGAGTLSASGRIGLRDPADTQVRLDISDFAVKGERAHGSASAVLSLSGRREGYRAAGDVHLGAFDVILPAHFSSSIPALNIIDPAGDADRKTALPVTLDLGIHAPGRVFVRGWGLDAEFGGDLRVTGTLEEPHVDGTLESMRGRYDEFGKRFELSHARLRFQGTIPPSPYLDIEAVTQADDVSASILLTGPLDRPAIGFSSVPALPQDEILSRILFGKDMSRITPFQAIRLAQTLRRFSGEGGGGFDALGMLRDATGLDDIRVDTDASGESSVGVGKYLTDQVYLELEKGRGETSGAAKVEIELTPHIAIESKIGQDSQGGAGLFWTHDY